jgi:hypothetical protein
LKKDQLIVQDLPIGRGQALGPQSGRADRMIGTQTNLFFTMSRSQTPCVLRRRNWCSGRFMVHEDGGADRDRTGDLKLAKLALSQLSYGPSRGSGVRYQVSELHLWHLIPDS